MIIGTAGHIDHGKTSLVRALTGVDTDRLKEEKARGISIDLGFAYMASPHGGILGFVDVPGHEKFIHNMLAGATGIDFALIVIAADDGVMPQTREHLAIIDLLGISQGIVALTKCDLADAARIDEVSDEIDALLAGTALAGSPVVPIATPKGEGVDDLRKYLFDAAHAVAQRASDQRFRLAVDRSFTLQGTGTVVTGTMLSGAVAAGDTVAISPSGVTARVRSIHAQNREADRGVAGERCAINLAGDGISKDAISRGDVVLDPALHAPTDRIDARLRLLKSEIRPLAQWTPVRLHHAASDVGGRIVLLGDQPIAPGDEALVQIVLDRPLAAASGDRFVLRDTTAQRTIGGGTFIDLRAPSRKRRVPERIAQLQAMAIRDPAEALAALLAAPPYYLDLGAFGRDRALAQPQIDAIAANLGITKFSGEARSFALSSDVWSKLKSALATALGQFHKANPDLAGIGLEKLRTQIEPRLPAPVFRSALQELVKSKEIGLNGAWVRLASHEVRLTEADDKNWLRIVPLISGAERFRPPRVRDVANVLNLREGDVRRIMKLVARIGRADEVAPDHFFLRSTIAEIVEILNGLSGETQDVQFTAAQLRDKLDNGRKVAIQILEFFDRHGVTLRKGDLRRINKHRLDLFRRSGETKPQTQSGREAPPVGRPDFKSGKGREPVLGGFDSLSLPPQQRSVR
jgi:selenocysteine-specific elongation factor